MPREKIRDKKSPGVSPAYRKLIDELADEFMIRIPDRHAVHLKTMGQLHKYIVRVLRKREQPPEHVVWQKTLEIVAHVTGRSADSISTKDRLREDIGIE